MTLRNLNVSSCQTRSVETGAHDGHASGVATTCAGDNTVAALIAGALDVTAARRLELAREALVTTTRERMRAELAISESELDSIMRVLTDVTIRQALELGSPRKTE